MSEMLIGPYGVGWNYSRFKSTVQVQPANSHYNCTRGPTDPLNSAKLQQMSHSQSFHQNTCIRKWEQKSKIP